MFFENIYFIMFNNIISKDIDLIVEKRPSIPSPRHEYKETKVKGRGTVYEDLGVTEDIDIPVTFTFIQLDQNQWHNKFRQIKKWVNNIKDRKLKFSDDLSFFYIVNKATITTTERESIRIGKVSVTFTCEPFMYLEQGQEEKLLSTCIYNQYEETRPIYKIWGEGILTLNVNGIAVKANVGQKLTIDTKLGLCYRSDGTINNVALAGKYEDLYIKEGKNTFDYTTGFSISLIPNWRCL